MNWQNQSPAHAGHSALLLAAQAAYEYLSGKVSVADTDYGVVKGLAAAISDVLDGKTPPTKAPITDEEIQKCAFLVPVWMSHVDPDGCIRFGGPADETLRTFAREIEKVINPPASEKPRRFEGVFCSQCGQEFGPGDSGFSDCRDHAGKRPIP